MGYQIFTTERIGDFLRDTGYKSIESAISEIIDNSIEAKCNDCFIILKENTEQRSTRIINYVSDIVFLDNGDGMNYDKLAACLSVGYTTREERKGMGRFGVGLPQSSLYACPAVDVYSWLDGYENCKKVFLNSKMVKDGDQLEIDDPESAEIPDEYRKFLEYSTENGRFTSFKQHGTLVHWKFCDRVQPATANSLLKRLDFSLGQKYRHLILNGTQRIRVIKLNDEEKSYDIIPNDPLMLMLPNYMTGNAEKEPLNIVQKMQYSDSIFEPYTNEMCPDGVVDLPVKYIDKETEEIKTSNVKITFSIVKFDYYDPAKYKGRNPGSTELGQHVKRLEGISVVRAGREIDFGTFDFYENINEPQHRWWGCEISFLPELDEVFGVSNNKQYVDLKRGQEAIDEDFEPIWSILYPVISPTIKKMYARNEEIQSGVRGGTIAPIPPSVDIVNTVEGNDDDDTAEPTPPSEEDIKGATDILIDIGVSATDENVRTFLGNKINIIYKNAGRSPFFDYSFELNTAVVTINTEHIFYNEFFNDIKQNQKNQVAFELFIEALVVAIRKTNNDQARENDNLMQNWEYKLKEYINEQCYPKSSN